MATSHQYLIFRIHLTDQAQVTALQGAHPDNGAVAALLWAPDAAAAEYHAPLLGKTEKFVAPCITSEWFDSEFPTDVAAFDRKSGGWFGWSWLFGHKVTFHWRGIFVYAPPNEAGVDGDDAALPIMQRRWIDGFELTQFGEGGQGSLGQDALSRMASRHEQGFGIAIRSHTSVRTHSTTESGIAAKGRSWERFYIRLVQAPDETVIFWAAQATGPGFSLGEGLQLGITPTGQLAVFAGLTVPTPPTLVATTVTLEVDHWYRLDLVMAFGNWHFISTPAPGHYDPVLEDEWSHGSNLVLYVNGEVKLTYDDQTKGMSQFQRVHGSSTIGHTGAHKLALDVDDWVCSLSPGPPSAMDFQRGSAIVPVFPTGLAATSSGWDGDWRLALQSPLKSILGTARFNSAVPNAKLALTTDAASSINALPNGLGCVALAVRAVHKADDPGVGYNSAAGNELITTVQLSPANDEDRYILYHPTGLTVPADLNPLELVFTKGPLAAAKYVRVLQAAAECLGVFGEEDTPPPHTAPPMPVLLGHHNAPYPRTPWATLTVAPMQPVLVVAGTYVGNGTGQELRFSVPMHFLWIRPVTGGQGVRWWSTLLAAHPGGQTAPLPELMVQACINDDFVPGTGPTLETLQPGPHPEIVAAIKADLIERGISIAGDCGAFEIVRRVAWQLRATGAGVLDKPTGTNCSGFATDIICYPDGSIYDVLINAGTDNTPTWSAGTPVDPSRYRAPVAPDDAIGEPASSNTQQMEAVFRLVGDSASSNAPGVTYAYFALGDPGMRFMCNHGLTLASAIAAYTTRLPHPHFTPQATFLWKEMAGGPAGSPLYKGVGHATASLSNFSGATTANALEVHEGTLLASPPLYESGVNQTALSAWRVDDLSGHAGAVVQILSYVGDGSASRTVPLVPASGKRPLFGLVVPQSGGGAAFQRDPAHTTTSSHNLTSDATVADNAITGGDIDAIKIGITINAVGVVYEVFVVPGSSVAGEGGWSPPGIFMPVPPEAPPGAPEPEIIPPTGGGPPVEPPVEPPGTGVPGLPTTGTCLEQTQKLCNLALSHLGITTAITALLTENTPEAYLARLHYIDEVDATLRAFPWPFATKYATPVWVAGTPSVPVNDDWQYAYRVPADLLFARRLVTGRKRAYELVPATFKIGEDAVGGPLLYTDVPLLDIRLEYTRRPVCAALEGDALFRNALTYRLAHVFAPGLARDDKKAQFCWAMYERLIGVARTVSANESQQEPTPGDPDWIRARE